MNQPIAVCISDLHFNLINLSVASSALRSALKEAEELNIPLIIAGDLHDTKAIVRAEVANELIDIFSGSTASVYCMVGNHDLIHERGSAHGLNYLRPYVNIIDQDTYIRSLDLTMLPYTSNIGTIRSRFNSLSTNILIMHQGFLGASMGDYVTDKTSIDPELAKKFTIISGHYHRHQTIGTVTYIGSPYTITFGEANDGPKGYLVLNKNGSFDRRILNIRSHKVLEFSLNDTGNINETIPVLPPETLLWVKIRGALSHLKSFDKKVLGMLCIGRTDYKLELIPIDINEKQLKTTENTTLTNLELLDTIIDNIPDTPAQKIYLKELYRGLIESRS
jgi:DNA repair exonuclease SbcCD nuclease subunit